MHPYFSGGSHLQQRFKYTILLGLLVASFSACSAKSEGEATATTYTSGGMETTAVINYVVTKQLPNVLVDREGYSASENKVAILTGKTLPEEFCVIDVSTGEEVYRSKIEKTEYHKDSENYTAHADFTALDVPGTYYVQCDYLGESYRFELEENLYLNLFQEALEETSARCKDGSLEMEEMEILLESYEWYADTFPDEDHDDVPDVLEAIRSWIAIQEEKGVDSSDEALYAALLAKFSYHYQKYDYAYATDCLKRASTVFNSLQTTTNKSADHFFALTELYRATGLYTYRVKIADYASFFENNTSYLEDEGYLYGAMTYLVTRQKVEVALCDLFIDNLMTLAEEISNRYEDMIHPLTAKNNGADDLLKNASLIACANYCMNNYQYTNICEDFLHYLMGRNRDSVNFYAESEEKTDYLLLLAGLASAFNSK